MANLIGLDFSINKPAACVFHHNLCHFVSWPYDLSKKIVEQYQKSGVQIIERLDDKEKGPNISSKMRYEVQNAQYLSKLIYDTLLPFLYEDTYIAFEGLSYASSGDVVLQLGGYKYMLMSELSRKVPLDNMFTYSPITVKSVAGCAKKGMGKNEMIDAFMQKGPHCIFNHELKENIQSFKNKNGKNWIAHLDDLVDAYFVLKTLQIKENLL